MNTESQRQILNLARQFAIQLDQLSQYSVDGKQEKRELINYSDRFRRYGEEEAGVVNNLFGFDAPGSLKANLPPRAYLGKFWKEVSPLLRQHPLERELYVGWDLIKGELKATEIVEGRNRAEIQVENEKLYREGKLHQMSGAFGSVKHNPHLLSFHSHVQVPGLTLPSDRYEQIRYATPRSSYKDISTLLLFPQQYGQIVLDISLPRQISVGRIMLAFKTTDSWQLDETNYEELAKKLINEMYFSDALDFHESATIQLPVRQVGRGTLGMLKNLQSDEHWCRFTGITIYRGLLSANSEINSTALRWDLFHQKIMGLGKEESGGFNIFKK